jgi:tetratricopeptide (TPR) repeat protein
VSLERLGRKTEALRVRERQTRALERQLELVPDDVRARILLAIEYASLGRAGDAVAQLERAVHLRRTMAIRSTTRPASYGVLDRSADALNMLRRAIKAGYANFDWVRRDPDLMLLRDEADFKELVG